jgi:hypothetical protein
MLIALAAIVGAVAALVGFVIAVVVIGTGQEPTHTELGAQAPSHLAGTARRMLGVHVGRPCEIDNDSPDRRPCIATRAATPDQRQNEEGDLP